MNNTCQKNLDLDLGQVEISPTVNAFLALNLSKKYVTVPLLKVSCYPTAFPQNQSKQILKFWHTAFHQHFAVFFPDFWVTPVDSSPLLSRASGGTRLVAIGTVK